MNFLKLIKQIFFLLLILLGTQTTYAKTGLVLPQNQVSFSIEQSKSFCSLEKVIQSNIGFLKEKSKFGKSDNISAQNKYEFSEIDISLLANGVAKFTAKQLDDFVLLATKQGNQTKVMLGKYLDGGSNSYIQRAGTDHTYFDLGSTKWKEAEALVNKNADEMWKINKKFIDKQKALNKEFYFSQEPWKAQSHEYLSKEAEYIIDLGAKDFRKINANTWKVIW